MLGTGISVLFTELPREISRGFEGDSGDTVYGVVERIRKYALPVCNAKGIAFESSTSSEAYGKGFDANKLSEGNGLKNIQYRAHQIRAVAKIWSRVGEGTKVEMVKG